MIAKLQAHAMGTMMRLMFAALVALLAAPASAGEVDAMTYLNSALATKARIMKRTVEHTDESYCLPRGNNFDFPERCQHSIKDIVRMIPDFARVSSSHLVEVKDLVFDKEKISGLPEQALIDRKSYENCGTSQLSISISASVTGQEGFSVQKSDSVTTGTGGSVTLNGTFSWGSLGTTLSLSRSVALTNTTAESSSQSVARSTSLNLNVGANKSGRLELIAYQTTIDIPYRASVVVDGQLEANASGVDKASDLLNTNERTIPFAGTLRLTNVSQGRVRNVEDPAAPTCSDSNVGLTIRTSSLSLPAAALPATTTNSFRTLKEAFSAAAKPDLTAVPLTLQLAQGTIGAPDGVHYEIRYTAEVTRPTPACGFNDYGAPINGAFNVEARHYSQYAQGKLVSEWDESVETFKECRPV